jgi:hypothetical protein
MNREELIEKLSKIPVVNNCDGCEYSDCNASFQTMLCGGEVLELLPIFAEFIESIEPDKKMVSGEHLHGFLYCRDLILKQLKGEE